MQYMSFAEAFCSRLLEILGDPFIPFSCQYLFKKSTGDAGNHPQLVKHPHVAVDCLTLKQVLILSNTWPYPRRVTDEVALAAEVLGGHGLR